MKNNKTAQKEKQPATVVEHGSSAAADLRELFVDCLKDIYWAENALVGALPKMADNASSPLLTSAIREHLEITKVQITRLDRIFELMGLKSEGKKCEAMAGLIKEGESMMKETVPGDVRDAAIIASSQKVEHYEIAGYGTLVAFAKALGENDIVMLLTQTLAEEKETDKILSDVACSAINLRAANNVMMTS